MAAVRIEAMAFSDPRIDVLASVGGYNRDEALGKLARLWSYCTERGTHEVDKTIVIGTLGLHGVEALLMSKLGERGDGDHFLIKGTRGRIEWLNVKRSNGARGGVRAQANKRDAQAQPEQHSSETSNVLEHDDAFGRANSKPLALPPTLSSGSSSGSEEVARAERTRARRAPDAPDGYQPTVDAFHVRYSAAYGGAKPTWGAKQGAMLKRLLKAHGADEVQRRIAVLFDSPPTWLKGPYDIGTLAQHFDKLVAAPADTPSGTVGRFDPSMNPKDDDDDNNTPPWELP